ncbi:Type I phosphodiesterase / nucleotide pyrophosphatase [Catalinimonas alkaloidigena]|uniref:Type I phosphodiesterase / nucleotide pyrophosphatase n=1 Tax=Catalinimonas alkaloidigena TaxID=1075417 RepID=A0A1G9UQW3_9BACT|nr:alkaline phosphatase PafA [Catalinimonas alkaloidigena]SDM62280.1 Type I phosphodiesterase / nucleotide pyrophosphatase [Catalinimonas alkaloidigena]
MNFFSKAPRPLLLLFFLLVTAVASAQPAQPPRLVVGVVVDQMRADYLRRFAPLFGEDGFKRLMRDGYEFRNTHYNHIPTYTGPGHASVYAGAPPAQHGIVANDWYQREIGRTLNCVEDTTVTAVGGDPSEGQVSPANLLATTITDELRLATNYRGKVVGVSLKNRGAVLPAGHAPNGAYWYDGTTGNFITSTYYTPKLPAWVDAFNQRKLADQYMNQTWGLLAAQEHYLAGNDDDAPYEMLYKGAKKSVMPYNLKKLRKDNGNLAGLYVTPFGNTIVAEMAKAAVAGEQLGQDDVPDFLAVSFSSTDYVGHYYGPQSLELEDTYARLDRDLADLLHYLDETVGEDHYTLFLTADHAAIDNPRYLQERHFPSGFVDYDAMTDSLQNFLRARFDAAEALLSISNDQIYLDRAFWNQQETSLAEVQAALVDYLSGWEGVRAVFTGPQMLYQEYTEGQPAMLQNGYFYKRSGDLLVLLQPGWLGKLNIATTHGSGYTYDTHVPLLWYGAGVPSGATVRHCTIYDIAPTLSLRLGTKPPSAAIGLPLEELFRK